MTHPKTREERIAYLKQEVKKRVLILDGAMGTMIQRYKLQEADYRGERFLDHPREVQRKAFGILDDVFLDLADDGLLLSRGRLFDLVMVTRLGHLTASSRRATC